MGEMATHTTEDSASSNIHGLMARFEAILQQHRAENPALYLWAK